MGRDKSRLRLGPRTMLGQIRATAKRLDLPVCIIRRDAVPRCGPLGGIYTALKSSSADAVMFLACDMPLVSEALLRVVRHRFARQGGSLFVRSEGRPGFPFVLRREALVTVARQIAAKRFSLHELARALRAKSFSAPANQRAQLRNVNTPGEWARVVKKWGQGVKRGT
jgi:molybdopterin-guanine dinucleotide biosynthesis protein A